MSVKARGAVAAMTALGVCVGVVAAVPVLVPARADAEVVLQESLVAGGFVSEGVAVPEGGRAVQLSKFTQWSNSYSTPKAGTSPLEPPDQPGSALDTVVTGTGYGDTALLRSTGDLLYLNDWNGHGRPEPAEGVDFTAMVSTEDGRLYALGTDGRIVAAESEDPRLPPNDAAYAAIAAAENLYALSAEGGIVSTAPPSERCGEAWAPAAGLAYTAIAANASDETEAWMALRSDGAVVTCGYGDGASVHEAPAGRSYVGVDAGGAYGLAVLDDGTIIPFGDYALAAIPETEGHGVVSLSAGTHTGAAVLDDGRLITWGESLGFAPFPEGLARFASVDESPDGETWAIWSHELLSVDIQITGPDHVGFYEPATYDVTATVEGGHDLDGWICFFWRDPHHTPGPSECAESSGNDTHSFTHGPDTAYPWPTMYPEYETNWYSAVFMSALTGAASKTFTTVRDNLVTSVAVAGPMEWLVDDQDIGLQLSVTSRYGTPPVASDTGERGSVRIIGWHDGVQTRLGEVAVLDSTALRIPLALYGQDPGAYALVAEYRAPRGSGAATTTTKLGTAYLRVGTALTADTTSTVWRYGREATIPFRLEPRIQSDAAGAITGPVEVYWRGQEVTGAGSYQPSDIGATGTVRIPGSLLTPGSGTVELRYAGNDTYAPRSWSMPVNVTNGVFTAGAPRISGTAQVGRALTAYRGTWSPTPSSTTYTWKSDGVTIKSGSSNTLVVPASAKGKRITVTVTGKRSGYTSKIVSSAPTALVTAGVFKAAAPTITGTARVGRSLTAWRGTWTPVPTSVVYVWKVNGTTYKKSTSRTFTIPARARGKRITVTVIGRRTAYLTKTLTSKSVLVR